MIIKLSEIFSKREKKKQINCEIHQEPFEFEGGLITPLKDISIHGEMKAFEDILELNLKVNTVLEDSCSRCLENFSFDVDTTLNEKFTNKSTIETEDIILVEGDVIDIAEVVINSIISTLPIKRLCSESCKGLCHSCGINLNHHKCNCENLEVDSRLEVLKSFFTDKEV
ncbi:DUF177 domain-containing protein [Clostridium sp. YIM B02506]|uniref:YceD family protein n=1 Tax=Clostridium sp. YIM B02506 TaxID=2910680 RepID=UPI001EEEF202|nr:DUF177 domain-containing protein [Clostridium sp. YIM B02506]